MGCDNGAVNVPGAWLCDALLDMTDGEVAQILEDGVADIDCLHPIVPLVLNAARRLRRAGGGGIGKPEDCT